MVYLETSLPFVFNPFLILFVPPVSDFFPN